VFNDCNWCWTIITSPMDAMQIWWKIWRKVWTTQANLPYILQSHSSTYQHLWWHSLTVYQKSIISFFHNPKWGKQWATQNSYSFDNDCFKPICWVLSIGWEQSECNKLFILLKVPQTLRREPKHTLGVLPFTAAFPIYCQ
jgi:hypothetical protein